LFGHGDVLVNNIAWFLRHLPVFGIPGDGQYRLQPVFVEDYADQIVTAGLSTENQTIDVAGPEIFTFESLVRMLRDALGRRTLLVHVPPSPALDWVACSPSSCSSVASRCGRYLISLGKMRCRACSRSALASGSAPPAGCRVAVRLPLPMRRCWSGLSCSLPVGRS